MHRYLVDEKQWLSEQQYLNALSFCMLLPGPEAMQLATYAGWRLHGVPGGLVAGILFVLPGAALIAVLGAVYALYGNAPLIATLFLGVKAAVLIIVIEAAIRVAKKALNGPLHRCIAGAAFVGIFFFALPYPVIILLAAGIGFLGAWQTPEEAQSALPGNVSWARTAMTIVVCLIMWWLPIALLAGGTMPPVFTDLGVYFSKLAVVTFGGAYAVLAYMAQEVVSRFGWLSAGEMMDGLGLAETTPGPLILVTQFVGFLAAYKEAGGMLAGLGGAIITLWVTFVPCFLWIFVGAPCIDWISGQPRLKGALSGITAAVVGVIINLSLWFGLHTAFTQVSRETYGVLQVWQPEASSVEWSLFLLAGVCAVLLLRLRWNIPRVLAVSMALGWVLETAV